MKGQLAVKTPKDYLAKLEGSRKQEVTKLHQLIRKAVPKLKPFILQGMLAYGPVRVKYASGKEVDWFKIGVASNVAAISLYACGTDERGYVAERYKKKLKGASIGKSCVRFKRLDAVDLEVLTELLQETATMGFGN